MLRCILLFVSFSFAFHHETTYVEATTPLTFDGLSQVVYFNNDIISGAKPAGCDGFASLNELQVKTIICVDGVVPDVNTAAKHGIKTIHIPLKYDAPSDETIVDLTTAVMRGKARGSVYIHCHHGKHRSAAVAAIVSIALSELDIDEAKRRMVVSETSEVYEGLWRAVEHTPVLDRALLLNNNREFQSSVAPEGMTHQMIALDEALENLNRFQQANWETLEDHPDLNAATEAAMMVDLFRSLQLSEEANAIGQDFETQVINAMQQASGLEEALLQKLPIKKLDAYLKRVEQSCIDCHRVFRN